MLGISILPGRSPAPILDVNLKWMKWNWLRAVNLSSRSLGSVPKRSTEYKFLVFTWWCLMIFLVFEKLLWNPRPSFDGFDGFWEYLALQSPCYEKMSLWRTIFLYNPGILISSMWIFQGVTRVRCSIQFRSTLTTASWPRRLSRTVGRSRLSMHPRAQNRGTFGLSTLQVYRKPRGTIVILMELYRPTTIQ